MHKRKREVGFGLAIIDRGGCNIRKLAGLVYVLIEKIIEKIGKWCRAILGMALVIFILIICRVTLLYSCLDDDVPIYRHRPEIFTSTSDAVFTILKLACPRPLFDIALVVFSFAFIFFLAIVTNCFENGYFVLPF
jgi:hypothetical protein